ncbi:MAG TPA: lipopolysaccharide biosynthesis protein RfbH [Candidatus Omnitrophota bacterium]|nr:lipopolysaccharide biosynthesis protein RfbH [Candidatus Omnitrophota bacterium]
MTSEEKLRQEILGKTREYYAKALAQEQGPFIPRKTQVHYGGRVFDAKEVEALVDASLDFWLTYGRFSHEFEKKIAACLGVNWAFLVNSGSSANLLALMALTSPHLKERRICRGDEVITVSAAFSTTVAPIMQYGAVPVFVDVLLGTYNIDASALEAAISKRTKAVMLAHTMGNPFDINAVKTFCAKHHLFLIEDNCDALGSRYQGQLTGVFGDIGTSSFYASHHITTGEGGAVYTSDPVLKKILLSLRDWGRDCWCDSGKDNTCGQRFSQQCGTLPYGYDHKYIYSHFGYNVKATEMQAAIGCAQLDKLMLFTDARRKNFAFLYERLKKYEDVFILPEATKDSDPSWFGFPLTLRDDVKFTRGELMSFLESKNIQTRNLFAGNIIRHPCFDGLKEGADYRVVGNLKNADKITRDTFWVGLYPGMTPDHLAYMADTFSEFSKKEKNHL